MSITKRDYRAERLRESKDRKAERASRGRARYAAIKAGKARVGDGTHVDHRDKNPHNNKKSNIKVMSAKANMSRTKGKNKNKTVSGKRKKHRSSKA
jgi:hypothetical protein